MGVTRRLFLDLIQEKVRSWLAGFSGRSGMSGSADYLMCCNCCSRVPMGTGRPRCRACSQLLCGQCMPAAADGIAEEGEPGGILCKDGPWRLPMICKFCSRAAGLAGAAADPEEGTESLTTPQQQCSPPSLHCSTARSYDEEEEEEEEDGECPGKHIWSPCSIFSQDVSDVDSSSFSTGNEFYSFKCLTPSPLDSPNSYEPGKLDLLEQDPLDSLRSSERVTGEPACAEVDQLIHLDIRAQEDCKPIDIENNDRLWLPPPPKDEGDDVENGYFEYDDEEDGVGHLGLFSTSSSFGRGNGDNDGHDDDDDDDDDDNDDGGGGGSFSIKERPNDAQKELLRTSVYGHFRALVSQLLNGEGIPSGTKDGEEGWLDVVSSLSWQAANFVKPDTSRGASMDPADYVKVKCITSGRPRESVLVKGVVCTKNVKHKRMISQHKNPRLLLLGGALEYQKVSNKLASLETVLQQEIDHLKMAVAKIEAHRPNVLLVEKTVSSYAQEYLLAKEISLVLNVKKPLLERISRCTGAQISPSVDNIASTRLGHCEVFRIERTTEEGFLGNQPGKKFSRTLMFFEGCPRRLGCTVLLRGPNRDELKKVKHILLYASFAAYHLSLETSFLADSGATLRRTPQNHQLGSPFGGECGAADSISGALDFPGPDALSPGHSGGLVRSARDESNPPSDPISTDPACSSASALSQRGGLCSSVSAPELGSAMGSDYQALDSGAHEERMAWVSTGKDSSPPGDYFSTSEGQQSILVSLSSSCVLKGIVCERSKLLRIKFYGNFDKPLGRYLRDDLFDQTSFCRCCREPPEAHVRCFTHQQGSLTINVKRLLSAKLPGECDGRIWMWHRCLRCAHKDGVPPATQRVVMSDAAWGLSFGKFLELSFSNQAIANRVASCGHSLQKDCLRFFGFGSMVAFFHYSPVNLLSVRLPPFELEFASQSQQEWLRREAGQIAVKVDLLHGEVLDVLRGVERKIAAHVDEPLKASLGNLLTELKDLLKNERHKYDVFLQTASLESFQRGHASSEVLELNRLRRCLLVDSYIWDRRIYLLDSKVKSSSLEIDVHLLEVSIHNDLMQRSESLPIGRRVDLSPKSGAKEPEGVDLLPSPVDCCAEPASGDSIYDENDCNERMAGGAAAERSPMGSSSSPGSSLSDKIDSAWTGTCHSPNGSPLSENDGYRKSTVAPVRVYSFDSSLVVRRRFHDLAPALPSLAAGDQLGFVRDPSPGIQRAYSHQSPGGIENLRFLFGRMPLYISSANRMVRDGARLLLPQTGARNVVIAVYDKEPSSVIAYALSSREHSDFVACGLDQDKTPEKDPIKDQWGRRAGASASRSLELEDVQSQYYGSEEALFSQGSVFLEPRQPHFKLSFVDESSIPSEKARFSVTCYFAKEFDALRRKCCPNELDVVCSLGRCRRWDAQGGKSNVYFAKSLDERFIIKQVTKTELESFEDFAPQYFKYLTESINSGSPTCLAKILGIYQVTIKHLKGGREVRMDLMVMENLFFGRNISRVYDLKGSLRSRYNANATGGNKVMLDLNLLESLRTEPIFLGSKAKRSLERAIWNDTSFLATVDVMDYSLLVGIDEEKKELVLGIIDFLRQYTWDKHLETWVKASGILGGPMNASPTVISPKQYKKRFRKAMSTYFLTVPDQWLP